MPGLFRSSAIHDVCMRSTLFLLCALALAACGGTTDARDASVGGRWVYRASVGGCDVTGVLRVRQEGSPVSGTLEWPGGPCAPSQGLTTVPADSQVTLSGRVDGESLAFTLHGWGGVLAHTGSVRADSMGGVVSGAPWGTQPGRFEARRYAEGTVLPGRFRAVVGGAVTDTLEGSASANRYELVMRRDDGRVQVTIAVLEEKLRLPSSPGTYRVHDWTVHADSLAAGLVYEDDPTRAFRMRDGTLTISSASGGTLRGTFDVTGYRPEDSAATVRVQGSFDAPLAP